MQEKTKTIIDKKKLAYKILYMPQFLKENQSQRHLFC